MAGRPNPKETLCSGGESRRTPMEDAELIDRIKNGQSAAYGDLVRKYQDRVFNACWRICGHLEDARDLTQEAFLKAYEGLDGFRRESGFYTWVFRVAVNLALSHRRKAHRRREVSLDQTLQMKGSQADGLAKHVAAGTQDDPARTVGEAELQARVVRALQALDDDHRAVIVLRDVEGFDYQEIGEILQIPPGTVKSRLHRARLALCQSVRAGERDR